MRDLQSSEPKATTAAVVAAAVRPEAASAGRLKRDRRRHNGAVRDRPGSSLRGWARTDSRAGGDQGGTGRAGQGVVVGRGSAA